MPGYPTRRRFLAQSAAVLALARTLPAAASGVPADLLQEWDLDATLHNAATPQPVSLGRVKAGGDLGKRTALNFARLQEETYRPPQIFRGTNWKSWPGDMEGRALLAVTLLARATGKEPDYFPAMVAAYPAQLNEYGYFGPALDLTAINEQQLSGHGWFLRGLCEYYEWKRDPATLAQIRAIIRNLAIPLRGQYAAYPIDPAVRANATAPANPGSVDGHLSGQHGNWAVSSDTGCAFIFLDGLAHAWVVLKSAGSPETLALKGLIDEAIARFLEVDLVAIKAQTHASLTGMRALLRVYSQTDNHTSQTGDRMSQTGDTALLTTVKDGYKLYRTSAMTEHYANTNWFGRPDSWTEPCAIIDSFMLATQLWQHTGEASYLEDAHLIWFNGVGRGLRNNGGFGTDTCSGYKSEFVKVRSYEAYFCCTMRGGEGHARAVEYLYFTRPAAAGRSGEVTVPFYSNSDATLDLGHGPLQLRQTSEYPYAGAVQFEVTGATSGAEASEHSLLLRLFAPSWSAGHRLTLNGKPVSTTLDRGFLVGQVQLKQGDILRLEFTQRLAPRDPINAATTAPGSYVFMSGPLVLGYTPPDDPAAILRSPDPAEVHLARNAKVRTYPSYPGGMISGPGPAYLNDPYGSVRYLTPTGDVLHAPINDLRYIPAAHTDPCPRQILFREA